MAKSKSKGSDQLEIIAIGVDVAQEPSRGVDVVVMKPSLPVANTPDMLIAMAIEKGMDLAQLEKLMDLQERWLARIAHEQYRQAMAKFQEEVGEVKKTKNVNYTNRSNQVVNYWYAPLSEIEKTVKPAMAKYGLTRDFKFHNFKDADGKDKIRVECFITHVAGHKEMNEMEAYLDESGSKNLIQAGGSTIEYLKRYTLSGALGISTADDDDGASGKKATAPAAKKGTLNNDQFEATKSKYRAGTVDLDKIREHYDLNPVQEEELLKLKPLLQVDEVVMKTLIKEVRGGVTLEEIKNRFNLSADQEKTLVVIIEAKMKQ